VGAGRAGHGVGHGISPPHVRHPARLPAVRPRAARGGGGALGYLDTENSARGRFVLLAGCMQHVREGPRLHGTRLAERSCRRCTTSGAMMAASPPARSAPAMALGTALRGTERSCEGKAWCTLHSGAPAATWRATSGGRTRRCEAACPLRGAISQIWTHSRLEFGITP